MGTRIDSPGKLMALFVVLSGVPLIALGWLGWRLLQQDRALDAQRLRDRLDNSATALVREIERELVAWDDLLQQSSDGSAPEPPAGAVVVIFDANGVVQQRGTRLPYFPGVRFPQISSAVFADAEADEFRRQDLQSAARAYTRLTNNPSLPTRAAALVRLARVLRKQERHRDALDVYASLAELGEITVAGSPAELVATRERMVLFKEVGNHAEAAREAAQLAAALGDGRFAIDRATFEFYHEAVMREGATGADLNARLALAGAVEAFWPGMKDKPSGRADWNGDSGAFIAVWRRTGAQSAAVVGRSMISVTGNWPDISRPPESSSDQRSVTVDARRRTRATSASVPAPARGGFGHRCGHRIPLSEDVHQIGSNARRRAMPRTRGSARRRARPSRREISERASGGGRTHRAW